MPTELRKETRDRVLEVANQLNYRPAARKPKSSKTRRTSTRPSDVSTVSFYYFSSSPSDTLPTNAFYSHVLAGLLSESEKLQYRVVLSSSYRHLLRGEAPSGLDAAGIGNAVLVGSLDQEVLGRLAPHIRHAVLVDGRDEEMRFDTIGSDGFGGSYQATKHLIALGHRRIGFLTAHFDEPPFTDRLNGFVVAHFDAELPLRRELIFGIGSTELLRDPAATVRRIRDRLVAETVALLKSSDRPTAFVCSNDFHALILMRACRELGVSIPAQMSVVGFDDTEMGVDAHPALTTVAVNKWEIGRMAIRLLDGRVTAGMIGDDQPPAVCLRLPVELIVRASTAPPPGR
jgi:LacI family transcriptional regulator